MPIEFPDEDLLDLLKGYGSHKSPTLRRLRFKEEGFQHLENGIRVTQFTELIICHENWLSRASKFLSVTPASLSSATGVTRLSMWLKTARDAGKIFLYNQPTKWSPQGAKVSPKIQLQAHQPPASSDIDSEASMETDASQASATPAPTYAEATSQLFSETPLPQRAQPPRKRGPSSPVKDSTAAKKIVDTAGAARDTFKQPENKAFISQFVLALKRATSPERVKLIQVISEKEYFQV